jgi:hypothetical protein
MGSKSGLAGFLLAAGLAAQAAAVEPGAAYGTFEGRGYVVVWPAGPPSRLVLYFHASGAEPLGYEARSGMLEALATDAGARGYALLAPASGVGDCDSAEAAPVADLACWRLDALDEELARVDRLVAHLAQTNNVSFPVRDAVGYELGADLVLAAFAAGRFESYGRIGLLDARPPAVALPPGAPNGTLIYLEAADGEPEGVQNASSLLDVLVEADYGTRTCTRSGAGGRAYDGRRLGSFLAWFAVDCRNLAPVLQPQSGTGGPPAVVIDGSRDDAVGLRPQG